MKRRILLLLIITIVNTQMQANGQNLILSLDCNSSEIRDGQTIKLVVIIRNPQKNNLCLDMSALSNVMSYLHFYKYENEKMVELYSGINATVLKANSLKQRLIKPTQAIKLMQEFELKNIKTIDMKTLDNYQGYAFVLETEGIFIPLEINDTTVFIQAKLKYGEQVFESNKIKLNINFKN